MAARSTTAGHAGQVLHEHPLGGEGDLRRRRRPSRPGRRATPSAASPAMSAASTAQAVLVAQQVLEEHLQRVGEPGHVVLGETPAPVSEKISKLPVPDRERRAGAEAVGVGGGVGHGSILPARPAGGIGPRPPGAHGPECEDGPWTTYAPIVERRLAAAFDAVAPGADPVLRPSERADLQANGAIAVARRLGREPGRGRPSEVVERLDVADVCDEVEVSGNGFINLTYADEFLAAQLEELAGDERLGIGEAERPENVVVDYSAPNVAKEMHVGHLRTTVIGDALGRMLDVPRVTTSAGRTTSGTGAPRSGCSSSTWSTWGRRRGRQELSIGDLTGFYQQARGVLRRRPGAFAERSRRRVVLLQSGDEETLRLWRVLVDRERPLLRRRLRQARRPAHRRRHRRRELLQRPPRPEWSPTSTRRASWSSHDGARCVFPPGFTNREGDPLPLIVQKSDGGYGYAATDLAAIRHRVRELGVRPDPLRRRRPPGPAPPDVLRRGRDGRVADTKTIEADPRRRSAACSAPTTRC